MEKLEELARALCRSSIGYYDFEDQFVIGRDDLGNKVSTPYGEVTFLRGTGVPLWKTFLPQALTILEDPRNKDLFPESQPDRFELIGHDGRIFSAVNVEINLSYQDDGKTLKVFIKKPVGPN
jgi:hypothetical protein